MPCLESFLRPRRVCSATIVLTAAVVLPTSAQSNDPPGPSFHEVLSLRGVSNPRISPEGSSIAYLVGYTDWDENRFDQEIWLVREGKEPIQLTHTEQGSSTGHRWSPDGEWLGFIADRGDGNEIYLMRPGGGEAKRLTEVEEGISSFRWSPDGKHIAFTMTEPPTEEMTEREKRYGEFAIEDADFRMRHLWLIDVADGAEPARLTSGDQFTVGSFSWSPDGTHIAFDHRPDPQVNSWGLADISLVDVQSGAVERLVDQWGADTGPIWSPDGRWILFSARMQDSASYRNYELAKIRAGGGAVSILTSAFDENPSAVAWNDDGIWFLASQGTRRQLFALDPESGRAEVRATSPEMIWSVDFSADGHVLALHAQSPTSLGEIYRTSLRQFHPQPVTSMTEQVNGWPLGSREVIEWMSRDGTRIEGVLFKPENYDPARRYPAFVVIHGGPAGTSRPVLVSAYVYPITQWLAKGAVVLMPNYRGSAGYGDAFRSLNVRNLGVGDAWDVLSGVDYLVELGIADPDRLAAMGWSQGGYISAFLTTTSDRFKAISVGAGISNWMTYYVNTDIHRFTRHYLKAIPWDDPEIYAKTSPVAYIKQAKTPTLIQHGEFDRRVPIPNAYELYQGLQDVGAETRLIVYKGFGHGITKPKERKAAMWHNWQWFAKYIWGEEVELPVADDKTPDR